MTTTLSSGTPATFATPGGEVRRGLVLLPDIGGLSPNFDRIAADLADRCSAAVAVVELFPGNENLTFRERLDIGLGEISESRVLADAAEAAELLDATPTAIMGVCIGGALAMRAGAAGRFDRVVSLYGMAHLPPHWAGDKGDPLEAVAATSVPVLQITGELDEFVSADDLDQLQAAGASVTRVAGAKHGFAHDPDHPNFHPDAAPGAWSALVDFLNTHRGELAP